jgi:hypothetical protein
MDWIDVDQLFAMAFMPIAWCGEFGVPIGFAASTL